MVLYDTVLTENNHGDPLIDKDLKHVTSQKTQNRISHLDLQGEKDHDPHEQDPEDFKNDQISAEKRQPDKNCNTEDQHCPVATIAVLNPTVDTFPITSVEHPYRINQDEVGKTEIVLPDKAQNDPCRKAQDQIEPCCFSQVFSEDLEGEIRQKIQQEDIKNEPVIPPDGIPPEKYSGQFHGIDVISIDLHQQTVDAHGNGEMIPYPKDPFVRHGLHVGMAAVLCRLKNAISRIEKEGCRDQIGKSSPENMIDAVSGPHCHIGTGLT